MNTQLLKQLGNMEQIAGIREAQLLRGRGVQVRVAEFYNAAGLRFTVVPDRCMDLYDFSYRGVNLSFQSKNGLVAPQFFSAADREFAEQWPGGMLFTSGLDNVGGPCADSGATYPVHGRISATPASTFGTRTFWDADDYRLRARGEMHQSRLFGRHLTLQRTIETGLRDKSVQLHDVVTNMEAEDEPYMLLYHFNFGYPLLQEDTCVEVSSAQVEPKNDLSRDYRHMTPPIDGRDEELFFHTGFNGRACAVIYNERLELGAYVAFDSANLPNLCQWKRMKSHDYVVGLEPCNTCGLNRRQASEQGRIALLPAYGSVENRLELGVLDGLTEIRRFVRDLSPAR